MRLWLFKNKVRDWLRRQWQALESDKEKLARLKRQIEAFRAEVLETEKFVMNDATPYYRGCVHAYDNVLWWIDKFGLRQ